MSDNGTWQWLLEGFKYELETQVKPKTVEYYLDHAKTFTRWAHDVATIEAPHLITKRDLQTFFHYLIATPAIVTKGNGALRHIQRTDRTRWHYYKGLRRFFRWLEAEGLVNENPMAAMKLIAPPPVPVERSESIHRQLTADRGRTILG